MKGVLADVNVEGYVDYLVALMRAPPWKLFWDHFALKYVHFAEVGLTPDTVDSVVWQGARRTISF